MQLGEDRRPDQQRWQRLPCRRARCSRGGGGDRAQSRRPAADHQHHATSACDQRLDPLEPRRGDADAWAMASQQRIASPATDKEEQASTGDCDDLQAEDRRPPGELTGRRPLTHQQHHQVVGDRDRSTSFHRDQQHDDTRAEPEATEHSGNDRSRHQSMFRPRAPEGSLMRRVATAPAHHAACPLSPSAAEKRARTRRQNARPERSDGRSDTLDGA